MGALSLVLASCTAGGTDQTTAPATKGVKASGTVTMWHFFSGREAKAIQAVVDDFTAAHPEIKVEVRAEQDDEKMRQAIAAGKGPDLGVSYSTAVVGSALDGRLSRTLRWLGLAAAAGQRFLLDTGTLNVLGYYREIPALKIWNAPIAG